jgi:hypothetical protein
MQSVPIASNVASLNPAQAQYYMIKFTAGRWFSLGPPVSSTSKTDLHNITELLLKVALNTINQTSHLFKHI